MSFSGEVKEELVRFVPEARHCQIAELAAILEYTKAVKIDEKGVRYIEIQEETPYVARKGFTLLKKTFNIESKMDNSVNLFQYTEREIVQKVLQAVKYEEGSSCVDPLVIKSLCCKRAFIRGAFLSIGSMSNPEKGYHMEFVFDRQGMADDFIKNLNTFSIDAKMVIRKKNYVVYIKEGEEIVDMLNIMGAHISLMNLENTRIVKDMRNSINRRVNCETANIAKTVNAAARQVEDILFIRKVYGLHKLPDNLRQVAEVRLSYPEASLVELSRLMDPPVGKSGVNHRLRKLSELAERLRVN